MASTMTFYFVLVATVLVSAADCSESLRPQSREKRQTDTEQVQDPDDPKYKSLATEAYEKYRKKIIHDDYMVRDVIVNSVTRQTVAGYIYRLTYNVEVDELGYRDNALCSSEVWEKPDHEKEFTTHCITLKGQRKGTRRIAGGEEIQDPKDPEYMKLAKESYMKFLINSHSILLIEPKSIDVKSATVQVVSGTIKRIDFIVDTVTDELEYFCHSEVWEQPWLHKKDIDVNCIPIL